MIAHITQLSQGAEAVIELHEDIHEESNGDAPAKKVVKKRITKSYRHPVLDNTLRKSRTRREAKILEKLQSTNVPVPQLHNVCDKTMTLHLQHIEGSKVRDVLEEDHVLYSKEIGKRVAELHRVDVIHGDLTTSNMIKDKHTQMIHFIDFGLSKVSNKVEDKAVDLHLLQRALESKHHKVFKEAFDEMVKEYKKNYTDAPAVLERLENVQKRGRHKHKKKD
jgi:TP53 regulating kinase and related kinases